mmetsp:Transcript_28944/g.31587  ORF Transcript_28944/g.31587 Transcript_28944/m.31587 type:complete len:271 (-) Transcript_28944:598-1410(-)|eukprot:CAMPEP_0173148688 /NCGR_PEP_ID=MMETSP1105-20130129/9869_1 /TAXON_ID=2985 /ORGANISM="Ochromonas sp., Strain BG-1" /LENGTH=270 /DNA_ID=CAMNT_0014063391 /DNA_START=189 /DNA_END=1001 /DNA_ORIENTATION=+
MKYLENMNLELLSKELSQFELGGGLKLFGRMELYSTKKAGKEKKESKLLDKKLEGTTPTPPSPPSAAQPPMPPLPYTSILSSSAPTMTSTSSLLLKEEIPDKKLRKLLIDLIQTLNASQIYRDFSELSLDSFISYPHMSFGIQKINSMLAEISLQNHHFLSNVWNEINQAFDGQLQKCKVYHLIDPSYQQELAEEGAIWSFDYFFCHEELRRICYFSCKAIYKFRLTRNHQSLLGNYSEDDDDDNENMEDSEGDGDDYDRDSDEDMMDWN